MKPTSTGSWKVRFELHFSYTHRKSLTINGAGEGNRTLVSDYAIQRRRGSVFIPRQHTFLFQKPLQQGSLDDSRSLEHSKCRNATTPPLYNVTISLYSATTWRRGSESNYADRTKQACGRLKKRSLHEVVRHRAGLNETGLSRRNELEMDFSSSLWRWRTPWSEGRVPDLFRKWGLVELVLPKIVPIPCHDELLDGFGL